VSSYDAGEKGGNEASDAIKSFELRTADLARKVGMEALAGDRRREHRAPAAMVVMWR
jgi:hypothetical protein